MKVGHRTGFIPVTLQFFNSRFMQTISHTVAVSVTFKCCYWVINAKEWINLCLVCFSLLEEESSVMLYQWFIPQFVPVSVSIWSGNYSLHSGCMTCGHAEYLIIHVLFFCSQLEQEVGLNTAHRAVFRRWSLFELMSTYYESDLVRTDPWALFYSCNKPKDRVCFSQDETACHLCVNWASVTNMWLSD